MAEIGIVLVNMISDLETRDVLQNDLPHEQCSQCQQRFAIPQCHSAKFKGVAQNCEKAVDIRNRVGISLQSQPHLLNEGLRSADGQEHLDTKCKRSPTANDPLLLDIRWHHFSIPRLVEEVVADREADSTEEGGEHDGRPLPVRLRH